MQLLSSFPPAVVSRAADPVTGIASSVEFLSIAAVKRELDKWAEEHWERVRRERAAAPRLEEPPVDPAMKERVNQIHAELKHAMRMPGFGIPKNELAQMETIRRKGALLPPSARPNTHSFVEPEVDPKRLKLSEHALRTAKGSLPWTADIEEQIDEGFSPSTAR